ncbi:Bug family tripartite tricarboxylate transporter substrate binding protein [Roseomonas fluvialis]|uniref:MFS transporter n=1 Tax=Roseomonas fluvialis TaxID=1750527 RepID=A0ABN6P9F1_9PROT|nr:tripartite tricarboxylate transporter substrate binding protein [Roseomonas fluvialis]BDG74751.1 MFS transporter [Roseomonas fluvialis]
MTHATRRALLLAAAALPAAPRLATAQAWPQRPIRWIVNFPPGGAADILSRTLGEYFGNRLGQPIVIENRPGAGGMLGADIVAKARGDVHTVMISSAASHGIGPVLYANVPYDPLADFTHIHSVGTFPSVLIVGPNVAAANVAELIALARARPGEITYGSGGNGTMNHLIGQLLARAAGINFIHVPYRGSAPAMTDVMGGQIPALMESVPTAMGNIRGGRMRPLATSEAERSPALPEVPTFAELGFPGVTSTNWFGFSAPAGIPPEIAARWENEIAAALASPQVRERFAGIGVRPGTLGAAAYTALIREELTRWREVIRAGNIRAD